MTILPPTVDGSCSRLLEQPKAFLPEEQGQRTKKPACSTGLLRIVPPSRNREKHGIGSNIILLAESRTVLLFRHSAGTSSPGESAPQELLHAGID